MSKPILLTKENPPREVIMVASKEGDYICSECILQNRIVGCWNIKPKACVRTIFGKTIPFHFELAFPKTE